MRKYGLWVGLGVVLLVAAVVIGVVAVRRSRSVAEQDAAQPAVGTDAMAFALGEVGRKYGGFTAPITDKPAKITQHIAIQKAREFAGGDANAARSVAAYHVLLTSTNGPQPSHGSTNSPASNFREQGQSAWMVIFKGVTRPPWLGATPAPDGTGIPSVATDALSKGNFVVLIDAETGEYIEMMSLPMTN